MRYRNVIDNREYLLSDYVNRYADSAKDVKMAVGFFYLSGFDLMKESVQGADSVKILMGRRTDLKTKDELVKGYEEELRNLPEEGEDVKKVLKLYELIREDKVDVKVYTDETLHSKLYLFKFTQPHSPIAIVGSSNLSKSGFTSNTELNVEVNDRDRTFYLEEWFDTLWDEAQPFNEDLIQVIETSKLKPKLPSLVLEDPQRYTARYTANRLKYLHTVGSGAVLGDFDPFYFQLQDANEVVQLYDQAIEKRGVLLGHEVGLGKTIITGIALNELMSRGQLNRVLIATPASLLGQWQTEMEEKFNQDFVIVDAEERSEKGPQVWQDYDKIIASMDFLKRHIEEDGLDELAWDMLVIDESHHIRNRNTQRYKGLKKIPADFTTLLTATPIHNEETDVFTQISLFHPDVEEGTKTELKLIDKERTLNESLIRRLRDDVEEFQDILPDRDVNDVRIPISREESHLYDDFLQYISTDSYYYKLLSRNLEYIAPLVKFIFLKEFCSSSKAFLKGLGNLRDKIEQTIAKEKIVFEFEDNQSLEEELESIKEELEKGESEVSVTRTEEGFTVEVQLDEEDLEELRDEIKTVNDFTERTHDLEPFSKEDKLVEQVETVWSRGEKAIVFVDFVPTGEELTKRLEKKGINTGFFQGSLSKTERQELVDKLEREDEDGIDVLVATDAGGLGLNLQAANHVFNHDLSWNPMVVEQRIGRVHRIGQRRDVFVHNLFNSETVEEHLHEVLAGKTSIIEEKLGMSGEVIAGSFVNDRDFIRALIEYETREISKEEYDAKVEQLVEKSKEYRDELNELSTVVNVDEEEIDRDRRKTSHRIAQLFKFFLENEEVHYEETDGIYLVEENDEFGGPYQLTLDRKKAAQGDAGYASTSHPLLAGILKKYGSGSFGTPSAKKLPARGPLAEYSGARGAQFNFVATYAKEDEGKKIVQKKHHPVTILGEDANTSKEFNDEINSLPYEELDADTDLIDEYEDRAREALDEIVEDEKSARVDKVREELETRFRNRLEKKNKEIKRLKEALKSTKRKLERFEGKSWESLGEEKNRRRRGLEERKKELEDEIDEGREELSELTDEAQDTLDTAKDMITTEDVKIDSTCILEIET